MLVAVRAAGGVFFADLVAPIEKKTHLGQEAAVGVHRSRYGLTRAVRSRQHADDTPACSLLDRAAPAAHELGMPRVHHDLTAEYG